MKQQFNFFKATAMLVTVCLISCSKVELPATPLEQKEEGHSIAVLKDFMSKQVGVSPSEITYDSKTEMFVLFGQPQIDRKRLEKMLNQGMSN